MAQHEEGEASTDPLAVMEAYTAAVNAHDLEAALALVNDAAVYTRPAGEFLGKEEIRGFLLDLFARNVRVELIGERQVQGSRVTWRSRIFLADPQNPDGQPLELVNDSESVVQNGRIVFHSATRAPSDGESESETDEGN
jgi:ketosteroid isomerase-like protein